MSSAAGWMHVSIFKIAIASLPKALSFLSIPGTVLFAKFKPVLI